MFFFDKIWLFHENARTHTHLNIDNCLTEHGIKVIDHSFYSSDLAPIDFYIYAYINKNLDSYGMKNDWSKLSPQGFKKFLFKSIERHLKRGLRGWNSVKKERGGGYIEYFKK